MPPQYSALKKRTHSLREDWVGCPDVTRQTTRSAMSAWAMPKIEHRGEVLKIWLRRYTSAGMTAAALGPGGASCCFCVPTMVISTPPLRAREELLPLTLVEIRSSLMPLLTRYSFAALTLGRANSLKANAYAVISIR